MDQQSLSFDPVAAIYAAVRPGYPDALFEDLTELTGRHGLGRVLEVGCGGGQATSNLGLRAASLIALDPGPNLIAEAQERVVAQNVEFIVGRFEDYQAPPASFDLIASAQAWHWIDPELAFPKAAALLREGGHLAVFGHVPLPVGPPFHDAFRDAFEAHAPTLWGSPPPQAAYLPSGPFRPMFERSGGFEEVTHRSYSWVWNMDAPTLNAYLRTDSSYRVIDEENRTALFDKMSAAVSDHGGVLAAPWETHLYVARRR